MRKVQRLQTDKNGKVAILAEICEVKEPVSRRGHQAETNEYCNNELRTHSKGDGTVQEWNMHGRQQKCIQGFGGKI